MKPLLRLTQYQPFGQKEHYQLGLPHCLQQKPQLYLSWTGSNRKYGLFTKKEIATGDLIGCLTGRIEIQNSILSNIDEYSFEISSIGFIQLLLNCETHGNIFRFMNHSELHNAHVRPIRVESEFMFPVYATKQIEKNEEITINYGKRFSKNQLIEPMKSS